MNSLKFNLAKLYIIQTIRWALFYIPTFVLFLQENGLSLQQVFLLQAIFSIAIIVLEIPSGYISDKLGRKNTIVAGSIITFLGALTYFSGTNFINFLAAEILLGIGASIISGTDSALIYDTLEAENQADQYKKKQGIFDSIANFSESTASILGGFLAVYSLRTTFIPYVILTFIAILVSLTIVEPAKKEKAIIEHKNPFKELLLIVKYSLNDHKEIAALIFYSGVIMSSTLTLVFFVQPYFEIVGLPLALFGIVWAIINFSVGIFTLSADKYETKLGRKLSLISLIIYPSIGYLLLSVFSQVWAILFILLFTFTRGISGPILKDYVNKHIDSSIRATVLSVQSLVGRLIFTIIAPFIGYAADIYSIQTAFQILAGIFFVLGTLSLLYLRKHKAL
jgi:MFS family permease